MNYEEIALENARRQGLTSQQVRAMSYKQIAELSGIGLGPGGSTPSDFFYSMVRDAVANILENDERTKKEQAKLETIKAWIKLTPSLSSFDAYFNEAGEIIIK